MASVTIRESGEKISCRTGENLLNVLLESGIFIDNPCNGTGVCGKCKIKVSSLSLIHISEPTRP